MQSQHLDLLPFDQQHLVRRAAAAIELEFAGTFGRETVERCVADSRSLSCFQLRESPCICRCSPSDSPASVCGRSPKCRDLTCRRLLACPPCAPTTLVVPEIAAGWMRHLSGESVRVWSAGSEPGSEINPAEVEVMAEMGIDITSEFPKPWTDEVVEAADVVVTMGCGDACPVYPGKRYEDWTLHSSTGTDLASARSVRDELRCPC